VASSSAHLPLPVMATICRVHGDVVAFRFDV
jgi:hypothetical protein